MAADEMAFLFVVLGTALFWFVWFATGVHDDFERWCNDRIYKYHGVTAFIFYVVLIAVWVACCGVFAAVGVAIVG